MASNKQIVEKADFANADLVTGGLLNPEQANRFFRRLINEPTMLRDVRAVEMNSPTRNINRLQFNKRILRAGTSATALDTAAAASGTTFDPSTSGEDQSRAKVQTSQVTLTTSEVIAEVDLPYDVIEDNVELGNVGTRTDNSGADSGGGFVDTVIELMVERTALDLEELLILGDESLGVADPYLDLQDGVLELVRDGGNTNDQSGAAISKALFKDGKKTMPDQYLRNINAMRHYTSHDQETEYRDALADRATGYGDATLQGDAPLRAFGSQVVANATMPDDEGIFTNPQNIIWGLQRQVMVEWDKLIRSRVLLIVLTARVAVAVEDTAGAVIHTNIGV
jgi:hypothetical protein